MPPRASGSGNDGERGRRGASGAVPGFNSSVRSPTVHQELRADGATFPKCGFFRPPPESAGYWPSRSAPRLATSLASVQPRSCAATRACATGRSSAVDVIAAPADQAGPKILALSSKPRFTHYDTPSRESATTAASGDSAASAARRSLRPTSPARSRRDLARDHHRLALRTLRWCGRRRFSPGHQASLTGHAPT